MRKERTRREINKNRETPGPWSGKATVAFYERYEGNFDLMLEVVETFDYVVSAPAFVAKIKDYVLKSSLWRGPNSDTFLQEAFCADCGKTGEKNRLTMLENRPYCDKCYVVRKYEN